MNTKEQIQAWEKQRWAAADSLRTAIYHYLQRRKELDPEGVYPKDPRDVECYAFDGSIEDGCIEFGDEVVAIGWEGYSYQGQSPNRYKIQFPTAHLWDPNWEKNLLAEMAEAKRLKEEEEQQKKTAKKSATIEKEKAQLRKLQAKYPDSSV